MRSSLKPGKTNSIQEENETQYFKTNKKSITKCYFRRVENFAILFTIIVYEFFETRKNKILFCIMLGVHDHESHGWPKKRPSNSMVVRQNMDVTNSIHMVRL